MNERKICIERMKVRKKESKNIERKKERKKKEAEK